MSDNRTALLCEVCRIMRDYGLDVDAAWTDQGTVAHPGKFECEPIETLYYHSAMLNGAGEHVGDWSVHTVDDTERQIFGLDADTAYVGIREDNSGFVIHAEMTEAKYQQILNEAQEDDTGEDF